MLTIKMLATDRQSSAGMFPVVMGCSQTNSEERSESEIELDLRGVERCQALSRLELLLRTGRHSGLRCLWVRLDPAVPGAGETLFVPIGRRLVDAWRCGTISHCRPLPGAEGGGYHVEYPA